MHQHDEMVGLDCAASVLGKVGHRVVRVAVERCGRGVVAVVVLALAKVQGQTKKGQRRVYDML